MQSPAGAEEPQKPNTAAQQKKIAQLKLLQAVNVDHLLDLGRKNNIVPR